MSEGGEEGSDTFSASIRKPFSAHSSSYVSPSSGLKGLFVRPAVPEYLEVDNTFSSARTPVATLPHSQATGMYNESKYALAHSSACKSALHR